MKVERNQRRGEFGERGQSEAEATPDGLAWNAGEAETGGSSGQCLWTTVLDSECGNFEPWIRGNWLKLDEKSG